MTREAKIVACPLHPDVEPMLSTNGSTDPRRECHVHCSASAKCWSGPSAFGEAEAIARWNEVVGAAARVVWLTDANAAFKGIEAQLADERKNSEALSDRIEALENLVTCYRLGRRPSEALFKRLEATNGADKAHRERRAAGEKEGA